MELWCQLWSTSIAAEVRGTYFVDGKGILYHRLVQFSDHGTGRSEVNGASFQGTGERYVSVMPCSKFK
jgi:hypothetical protein